MNEEAKKAKYVKFVLRQMIATIEEAEAETVGDAIILVQRRCDALAEELSNGNSRVAQ